jgi:N-acetylmuramoyl-L-alanine amidase
MEDVAQTKLRLIREAIQDNLPRGPHSKLKIVARARRFPLWIPVLALSIVFASISLRGFVSQTNSQTPAPTIRLAAPAPPADAAVEAPAVAGDVEPAPPASLAQPPHPLNRAMFPLSVNRIVIDPGHGGFQHGAASQSGVSEKDITLQIALRLRRLLKEASFEVLMTREADQAVSLEKRAEFANDNHADLFVSIHINWTPFRNIRPLETYFLGPTDDPEATKLVAMENRDSGYSLSDYRQLLEKTYLDARRDESRRLARAVEAELYRSISQINPAIEDRGVKTAPFAVLIRTDMPAILVEVSCLSNEDEVKLLTNQDYQENIAQALLTGIRSYASDLEGSKEKIATNGTSK